MDYTDKLINGRPYRVFANGRKTPIDIDPRFVESTGLSNAEMIRKSANGSGANSFTGEPRAEEVAAPKSAAPEVDVTEDKENTNE